MDKQTQEALRVMAPLRTESDVVYEVLAHPEKSGLFHVVDTLLDLAPSVVDGLRNQQVMYLIASDEKGQLVAIADGMVVRIVDVPNWEPRQKESFKKVIIDKRVYKKFKRLD